MPVNLVDINKMKTIPRSPLRWVTSLYFAMGLPFVVLNMVSAVLFKDLGITDARIAFWTSLIMWPWTIKFLWSPFLEFYRTKRFWVVATQFLSGVLFGLAALSLHLPSFFAVTVALFAVVAFSGATHDIAADGVYMAELSTEDQAKYIGWQGAFYNLAKLLATGGLVWFAGWLYESFSAEGTATFDAYVRSWTVVLAILCATLVALGAYHLRALPSGGAAAERRSLREGLSGLKEVIAAFFTKRHIWYYIAFIILYRLGEGFVMKIVPLFLKADTASGGLGLTNQQIGLYYGTFGAAAFLLGSLLAGYYIARRPYRRGDDLAHEHHDAGLHLHRRRGNPRLYHTAHHHRCRYGLHARVLLAPRRRGLHPPVVRMAEYAVRGADTQTRKRR